MSVQLRSYQTPHFTKLIQSLIVNGVAHDGSDTGTGKTYVGAALMSAFNAPGLIVSPLSVVPAWRDALDAFGAKDVQVVNYEKAWRRLGEVKPWGSGSFFQWHDPAPFTIFDEAHRCFIAGTPVACEEGSKPIESIAVGDLVLTPLGYRPVVRTIAEKGSFKTITIIHEHGKFTCTPDHKISTQRGWVLAENLSVRDTLYSYIEETIPAVLLPSLLRHRPTSPSRESQTDVGESTPQGVATARSSNYSNDREQPNDECSDTSQGQCCAESSRVWPEAERWKRERAIKASIDATGKTNPPRVRLDSRISNPSFNPYKGMVKVGADLRYWHRGGEAGGRLRRAESPRFESQSSGHQKGQASYELRMDGPPFQEFRYTGGPSSYSQGYPSKVRRIENSETVKYVYCLTVEEAHVFYAGNALVANCGGETSINSKMMIASVRARLKDPSRKVLTLSASIASAPLRMKAFGYLMGLHDNANFRDFLLKCNCKPGTFGGWTWNAKKNGHIMSYLHELIYGAGKGSRMIRSEIPGFPKTMTDVRCIPDVDKQVLRLSEELRGSYNERQVAAYQTESELARMIFMRQSLETAKVPFICDMVTDALETSKVVVFCNFTETIEALCDAAKRKGWTFATITGAQSATEAGKREREAIIKAYQRNEYDVLFCNIQAGGVGVSLHDPFTQVPRTAIICPTFSAEDLKQTLGRVHRDGGGFSRQFLLYFGESLEGAIAKIVKTKLGNLDLLNDNELSGDFRMAA